MFYKIPKRFFSFFIVIFWAEAASFLNAQQYTFINFSTEQGLPQSQVTSMCQDNKGYLWFATLGGISRFDGINFYNYSKKDGLVDNQTHSLFIDSRNKMYVGSLGGFSVYDGKTFVQHILPQKYRRANVISFAEDDEGQIWMVLENMGVCKLNHDGKTEFYNEKNGLNSHTRNIFFDKNKRLWIATRYGLFLFDKLKNHFKPILINGESDRNISCVIEDKNNSLWIATFDEGVFRWGKDTFINYTQENGLISDAIRMIHPASDGSLWFASNRGISVWNNNVFQNFNSGKGLISENIRYISQDNEDNIWICSDGKGILKYAGEAFVNFNTTTGLSSDIITSITEDKNNNLWIATYNKGVCFYDRKDFLCYDDSKYLSNNTVWTVVKDQENNIWFGTSNGLNKFDGKKFYVYTDDDGLLSNKIIALYNDAENLWIGTQEGLNRFYKGVFYSYHNTKGANPDNIRNIFKDANGILWLASSNGLFSFNGKDFTQYKPFLNDIENTIYSIKPALQDGLWLGTKSGLFYFKNGKFNQVIFSHEVSSNYINFLLVDENLLWIGTNNNIFCLNQEKYFKENSIDVKNYSREDGIAGMETNMNAAYKDTKGFLWFGTDMGLVRFNREKQKINNTKIKPYIHIDDIRLYFEKADWKKYTKHFDEHTGLPLNPVVEYKKNHFTFYYTGISHSNPKKIKYQFKLDGFDEDWSPETEARFITYSNLPHGTFTFMVKAKNDLGIWSDMATFSFTIKTPFWLAWWFIFFSIIVFAALLIIIYNSRLKQIKRKNERQQLIYQSRLLELEQQALNASMNRHFIFNALNSIQYYINKQDRVEANRYLTSFAKLIRKNLDSSSSGQMVTLAEELERLELYISLENMRFKNKFTYEIKIQPEVEPENIIIPPMMLQPYVENSIWHGILPLEKSGHILIDISKTPGGDTKFIIEDNGIGIETSLKQKQNDGNNHVSRGIEITSGRLEVLKKIIQQEIIIYGPYELKNDQNETLGTRIEIIIPQPKRPFPKI